MSQWKDDPQRCQSVYTKSTVHEKASVNICSENVVTLKSMVSCFLGPICRKWY